MATARGQGISIGKLYIFIFLTESGLKTYAQNFENKNGICC